MNPFVKIQLCQDIFFSLQNRCSMDEIVDVLGEYQIAINKETDCTQKKIRKILSNTSDEKLFFIAKDLKLNINNYFDKEVMDYVVEQDKEVKTNERVEEESKDKNSKNETSNEVYNHTYLKIFKIDTIFSLFMALLIPKLIFLLLKWTNENPGGAAITSLLKRISLNIGMEEGVGVFVFLGILFYKISEFLMEKYYVNKIEQERLENKLLTQNILHRIESYPVSKSLQQKLKTIYVLPS